MKRTAIKSSLLSAIAWEPSKDDPNIGTLEVEFPAGKSEGAVPSVYQYANVPKARFEEFQQAESHGKFFLNVIKGKHAHTKMEQPKPPEQGAA